MEEEKQEKYEFVDKRRVKSEAEEAPQAEAAEAPQAEAPQGVSEEEAMGAGLPDVDIYGLLGSFFGMLHGFAWQKMGLMANPSTGKIDEDLPQAKIAIDTMQFLVGQLEAQLPESEKREVRRMMMDMQMNYMRRSSGGA